MKGKGSQGAQAYLSALAPRDPKKRSAHQRPQVELPTALDQIVGQPLGGVEEAFLAAIAPGRRGGDRHFGLEIDQLTVGGAGGSEAGQSGADDVARGKRLAERDLTRLVHAAFIRL